jgi:hypothetical protein
MSLAAIAKASGKSLSQIKRMSVSDPGAVRQLIHSLHDSKDTEENDAPGTLAQFEGRFLATHSFIAMIRSELRDSRPDVAAKLDAIQKVNQPWVDWLDS